MASFSGTRNSLLHFGKLGDGTHWQITDPYSEELAEARWALRHGTPTRAQLLLVDSAAQAYIHLTTYPLRSVVRRQYSDILRALKVRSAQ